MQDQDLICAWNRDILGSSLISGGIKFHIWEAPTVTVSVPNLVVDGQCDASWRKFRRLYTLTHVVKILFIMGGKRPLKYS